jgi:hypothetical protein
VFGEQLIVAALEMMMISNMKLEVFTLMKIQVVIFWVAIPCTDVGYHRFGEPCLLHLQGED